MDPEEAMEEEPQVKRPQEDEDMWLYGEDAAAEMQSEAAAREIASRPPPVVVSEVINEVVEEPASVEKSPSPPPAPVSEQAAEQLVPEQEEEVKEQDEEEQNQLEAMFGDNVADGEPVLQSEETNGHVPDAEVEPENEANGDEDRNGEAEDDSDDDDDDDDDIQVTIGDIKSTTPGFPFGTGPVNLNITKRGPAAFAGQAAGNAAGIKGKGATLDFDTVGTFNDQEIYDVNLDSMDEKPWRKPGADITDYFNYGFTEDTWKIYCERQKRLRTEVTTGGSGSGMSLPMPQGAMPNANKPFIPGKPGESPIINLGSIVNENSKYSAALGPIRKAGPPPGRKASGTIDVIGGSGGQGPSVLPSRRPPDAEDGFSITVLGGRPPLGPPGMPLGPMGLGPPPLGPHGMSGPPPPGMLPGMPPGMPGGPPPWMGPPPLGFPPFGLPPPFNQMPDDMDRGDKPRGRDPHRGHPLDDRREIIIKQEPGTYPRHGSRVQVEDRAKRSRSRSRPRSPSSTRSRDRRRRSRSRESSRKHYGGDREAERKRSHR